MPRDVGDQEAAGLCDNKHPSWQEGDGGLRNYRPALRINPAADRDQSNRGGRDQSNRGGRAEEMSERSPGGTAEPSRTKTTAATQPTRKEHR